jgi:hypothetical protein
MANLTGHYDPNAEAQEDFSPLPSGDYLAHITDSDMEPFNNSDGEYLALTYTILEGPYKNRKVWANLSLLHPNAQTVQIANRQFSSIREATGVANPRDSQDLHYKPHVIRVEFIPAGTVQGKNGYVVPKDKNEVKAWKKATPDQLQGIGSGSGAHQQHHAPHQQSNAAPQQSGGAPSWARKNAA